MAHTHRRCTFTHLIFLCCLGCLGSPTSPFAEKSRRVLKNVALHAQRPPSPQAVVGSAVTMAGVRQALLRRDWKISATATPSGRKDSSGGSTVEGGRWSGEGTKITQQEDQPHVRIFYPFNYEGLHARSWDLVIIEGWFGMINSFIHEVRAISHPLPVTVLFYCLDPEYPGLPHVAALDVEGFLTNSESTRQYLRQSAPTALVPLAVDTEAFPFYPNPPRPEAAAAATASSRGHPYEDNGGGDDEFVGRWNRTSHGRVVYVGSATLMEHKEMLPWVLREAAPFGLDIYGNGWQDFPEFSEYWRGVLPQEDLAFVYGSALAVVGVTTDAQRESGKINNRVYEALSVGAPLISDHFPALEATFGDALLYARRRGDVARHIESLLHSQQAVGRDNTEASKRRQRRDMIEGGHTWSQRVEDILSFVGSLHGNSAAAAFVEDEGEGGRGDEAARCSRQRGCLNVAIVVDHELEGDITFESTFVPAVDLLLGSTYIFSWFTSPQPWGGARGSNSTTADQMLGRGEEEENTQKANGATYRERRAMQLPRDADCLSNYDAVWATGRWGGAADRTVRELLQPAGTTATQRGTTSRLTAQLKGMVLWGPLCTPRKGIETDREGRGPELDVRDYGKGCPGYAGREGLRWYDVVYCQTNGDHDFLLQQAFEGDVSDNLQQAWGYGSARGSRSNGGPVDGDGDQGTAAVSTRPLDMLVVGTDDQVPDILRVLNAPGLGRVVLAVVVTPAGADATAAARPGLASILAAARVDAKTRIDDLPQRVSVCVVDSSEGSSFTPLITEVLLVRGAADADALAELSSRAAKVAVLAVGQLGAWAVVVTTSEVHEPRWRRRFDVREFDVGDSDRLRALIQERPEAWNADYYSRRLVAGMTRGLCLGRGNSRISFVRPASESPAEVVGAINTSITVEVLVEDFHVGRDGEWCITVQGRTALCVLQNEFVVDINISSSASESEWESVLATARLNKTTASGKQDDSKRENGVETCTKGTTRARQQQQGFVRVEVGAELRSNMYKDVLQRSKPFYLYVDPIGAELADVRYTDDGNASFVGGEVGRGAFQTSIDLGEYLESGSIVAREVARPYERDTLSLL
ncbi:unnamed protein product [Ectocarpus sp. 12 AP-2014]